MDNIAHSLTALMMARAGLNRLTPYATPILLISANLPDIDIIPGLWGSAAYLDWHRSYPHSLYLSPLIALLPVLAFAYFGKQKLRWIPALLISYLGVLSHLALDLTNTYGTRLLLPQSSHRFHLDITNVYDTWFFVVLGIAVIGPILSRLVSSEIGAKPSKGRGLAITALTILTIYDASRFVFHQRAVELAEGRMYSGAAPTKVMAAPSPFSLFRWTIVVDTREFVGRQAISVNDDFHPELTQLFYKPSLEKVVPAVYHDVNIAALKRFAEFPLWEVVPADEPKGAQRITLCDLRFGDPGDGAFCAVVVATPQNTVIDSQFHWK